MNASYGGHPGGALDGFAHWRRTTGPTVPEQRVSRDSPCLSAEPVPFELALAAQGRWSPRLEGSLPHPPYLWISGGAAAHQASPRVGFAVRRENGRRHPALSEPPDIAALQSTEDEEQFENRGGSASTSPGGTQVARARSAQLGERRDRAHVVSDVHPSSWGGPRTVRPAADVSGQAARWQGRCRSPVGVRGGVTLSTKVACALPEWQERSRVVARTSCREALRVARASCDAPYPVCRCAVDLHAQKRGPIVSRPAVLGDSE